MPTETPDVPESPIPETWGILSQFGHTTHAGRISEVEMFGEKMGRIDVPQADGSFKTQLFSAKSIFGIEFTTEAAARVAAMRSCTAYLPPWDDEPKALPVSPSFAGADDSDRYDDDREEG